MKRDKLMQALTALGEEQEHAETQLQQRMDSWWNAQSQETQMAAFYCVVSRIVQAELREDTTYRSLMRGTFEFGEHGYGLGLACGAMELHNAIVPPRELSELRALQRAKQRRDAQLKESFRIKSQCDCCGYQSTDIRAEEGRSCPHWDCNGSMR